MKEERIRRLRREEMNVEGRSSNTVWYGDLLRHHGFMPSFKQIVSRKIPRRGKK